ncbi:MAG TPA: MBOAT family O-acyltransferase [Chitinispirillaceae bacterium]|nr:MBOAT family O-acyltransferase [Chitinispirillaceae bacterium]
MVFSSHIFLFYFFPVVLLLYYLLPSNGRNIYLRNSFLTIVSYIFYGWTEPWFVILMWVSTFLDYIAGKIVSDPKHSQRLKNFGLVLSCVGNLGMLGFFKYYMFFMGGINSLIELFGGGPGTFYIMNITLPVGISFYTFQTMSYTIDVWRGNAPPVKNLSTFSCFVALFPQLIAGPIVRYVDVAGQLGKREHSYDKFASGAAIFITGFAKKILLANPAGLVADAAFGADSLTPQIAWWGILGYHFQIYFDFCGYSDMAVGLGRMFGFEFVKNFNAPYRSVSITDFWRRWHISLSTWILDYIYISLGGNRKGAARTYINLMICFFLSGLWHGAKMTFICWGLFQAFFLITERFMGKNSLYGKLPRIPQIIITNIIVLFGWVLFRAPDLGQATDYWNAMIGIVQPSTSALLLQSEIFSLRHIVEMVLCAFFVWQPVQAHIWVKNCTNVKYAALSVVFLVAIAMMFAQSFNPFLYFQF